MARMIETQVYRRLKQRQNNTVEVRRDSQIVRINEADAMVGDILILKRSTEVETQTTSL